MLALTARQKNAVLICASGASSLIMLDTNIVAVALPTIARDLHAGFVGVQWIISAYLITFAALLLPSGSLADLHGRRRTVMIGIALFLVSSATCGLAPNVIVLDISRAVQGIGGSLLLTSALPIIGATFTGADRARAFATWGMVIGIAIALGPIAGGVITSLFGWRWAFLINVPICMGLIFAVRAFVPESSDPDAQHLDTGGLITLSIGLFALIAALIDGNEAGWLSATILVRLLIAAAALTLFVLYEQRHARPMLDLHVFSRPRFLGAASGSFGFGAGAQTLVFFLPIYLQGAFGFAPMAAGFAMLPFAAPLFLAPRIAHVLIPGWSPRSALLLGMSVVIVGELLLAALAPHASYPLMALAMLVAGAGAGMLNPETARAAAAEIPPDRSGMAHFRTGFRAGGDPHAALAFSAVAYTAATIVAIAACAVAVLMAPRPLPVAPAAG